MLKWLYQFDDEVLERAKLYVDDVSNVKKIKDKITCDVRGSNLYYVRLTIKNELVTQFSCTCPYYSNCKHEAALLY
ncbi:MAG: hypothetical protein BZ136_09435 [Methanosphaera sp. rholeuAM74]|nr:MAG: hypothetical protein BZ136_09435 [Methanosphaera sp. rholeuAM74]